MGGLDQHSNLFFCPMPDFETACILKITGSVDLTPFGNKVSLDLTPFGNKPHFESEFSRGRRLHSIDLTVAFDSGDDSESI